MATVRRHLIIEPRFQFRFAFAFMKGVFAAVTGPALAIFLTAHYLSINPSLDQAKQMALANASHDLIIPFLICAGALAAASGLVGLFLSHRYAGPLKRIESWAARRLLGEPIEDLVLRPKDEMATVASVLTRVLKKEDRK